MQADKLYKSYRFEEAIAVYKQILEQSTDSLYKISIEKKLISSENGKALLEFACIPDVIASEKFNKADFFLHDPGFPDKSWVPLPKELAETTNQVPEQMSTPILYYPSGSNTLIYSAPDNSGSWNLYTTTKLNDTLWSTPVTLNENITSVGNELFPYLSANGKTLYFSSNGHYGMGGYDLYVSYWDEDLNDWGVAQNMGFPFSSVGDDFLFYNTPDGLFSVFTSNRDNSPGEVTTYAILFESNPLKKNINAAQAEQIARLQITREKTEKKGDELGEKADTSAQTSEYTIAVKEVRRLQQAIKAVIKQQQENRNLYNTLTNSDDLALLAKKIEELENKTLSLQQELNTASVNLQSVEMDFLSKGIIIADTAEEQQETKSDTSRPAEKFKFANNTMGSTPAMIVEKAEPKVDLSLRILNEAVVADIADFPKGLVYQIQLFLVANKAPLKALKGLSPVFERKTPTGKYLYSVGTFHTYEEALQNINKVKKLGFPSALITAYNGGKSLPTKDARLLEQKEKDSAFYQLVIEGFETLPAELLKVIRESTEKDIAKSIDNGVIKYVVGPFATKNDADELKATLDKKGFSGTQIEKVEKN